MSGYDVAIHSSHEGSGFSYLEIPQIDGSARVILDQGNQVIGGMKTFTHGISFGDQVLNVYKEYSLVTEMRWGPDVYSYKNVTIVMVRLGKMV